MPHRPDQVKAGIFSALGRRARARLPERAAADLSRFCRLFYAGVAADDLRARSLDDLLGAAAAMLDFAAARPRRRAKVRVYNPTRDLHGWESPHTAIEVVNDDMPFLVDSASAFLSARNIPVQLLVHPVLRVRRDRAGRLLGFAPGRDPAAGRPESLMHIEVDQQPESRLGELAAELERVFREVRIVVEDWRPMRARLDKIIAEIDASAPPVPKHDIEEAKAFLAWVRDHHFTFQGFRSYDLVRKRGREYLRPVPGSGLGLLRRVSPDAAARHKAPLSPQLSRFIKRPEIVVIAKATTRTSVHRAAPLDFIGIRRFDRRGKVIGQHRILGLFTSLVYGQSPRYVPLLRDKVARVIARAGFDPMGHDGKALLHILETFPRDELFQCSQDELYEMALGVLRLQERQKVALFVRRDPYGDYVSCLVYVPRDRYTSELRRRFQAILEEEFRGATTIHYVQVGDEPLARLHLIIATPRGIPEFDAAALEARLIEAARAWPDRLREELRRGRAEADALAAAARYAQAFPPGYQDRFGPAEAVFDAAKIEEVIASGRPTMHLDRGQPAGLRRLRLKLYHPREPIALSDILPTLENLGFRAITEIPFAATPAGAPYPVWIQDIGMECRSVQDGEIEGLRARVHDCLARVWTGAVEDDGFNRLILAAGLDWREAALLRAYCRFLRQAGIPFAEATMQETLARNAEAAALLVRLFRALFDPAAQDGRGLAVRLERALLAALDRVAGADEDRILRRLLNLIGATVRTNYFQPGADGKPKPYLALKFDSRRIEELPAPRPMFEIFVYSPEMEGVHLRAGPIARGGIRWSDRREDFRTEILGLMKAQTVKNAVIVPVGAKGGFVVKGQATSREQGIACYKVLIRGLLDLTDNLVRGRVVPPPAVVRRDRDDPYLVVAADKGTATFSDIANGLSAEYGFWLGDAFASGGAKGYDHKKMGITARGAWISVERHFRELGRDIRREDFTAVGVGDMSGDVFGNAMLLSRRIRLVGAFDHRHVFLDPDPDPEASFVERQRLFRLPSSSWADYRRGALSKGGGVFARGAKSIPLSPEVRARFGLQAEAVPPATLIQALLRANVDLLWFGGIGTFIRASFERDAEVGDRMNDSIRVTGRELRCRVVGEGANLALTQRGRIEYALSGGRINTDAIDNSAGVDCSDHEVNIKILLDAEVARGNLTPARRDRLLARMTEEVAALVLRDNYLQTQAISLEETRGAGLLDKQARLTRALERAGRLDRAVEFLRDEEGLAERARLKRGLTRPEIAVLLAYAKIALSGELVESDLPDDRLLAGDLVRYFPRVLGERFRRAILRHPLRREIVATQVANSLVNRMGSTFVNEMKERTDCGAAEIARAYAAARDIFGLRALWAGIEALDGKVPASVQAEMAIEICTLVERATTWLLTRTGRPLDSAALSRSFGPGVRVLAHGLEGMLGGPERQAWLRRAGSFQSQGVPQRLARHIAALAPLGSALDIVAIARSAKRDVAAAGRLHFRIGERFGFARLRSAAASLPAETAWERQAVEAAVGDLHSYQGALTAAVLREGGRAKAPERRIDAWIAAHKAQAERAERVMAEIAAAPGLELPMLAVASRALRQLGAPA